MKKVTPKQFEAAAKVLLRWLRENEHDKVTVMVKQTPKMREQLDKSGWPKI